jgi:hypothetical protein
MTESAAREAAVAHLPARPRPTPRLAPCHADEQAAHAAFIDSLGAGALWRRYDRAADRPGEG